MTGLVTEILVDCTSYVVLNDDGTINPDGPVRCDGGSFVVVGGTQIQTSSGGFAAEGFWANHPENLEVGSTATFRAVPDGFGGYTLNCDECGLQ